VNRSAIMLQVVRNMNDQVVTPISDYSWAGNSKITIESQLISFISIRRKCCVFNGEPIF
jgi:hypothetical protein